MKFRLKIMAGMICLLSVLFAVGGSLLLTASFSDALSRERESAVNAYRTVFQTLQIVGRVSGELSDEEIADTIRQLSGSAGFSALRLRTEERTVYESGTFPDGAENADAVSDLGGRKAEAATGGAGSTADAETDTAGRCAVRYLKEGADSRFLLLNGSLAAGTETLFLDMAFDVTPLLETVRREERIYQLVFCLLTALCALLSYSMARILTRPLSELSRASRAIAGGDLSRRARIETHDEIGRVARDFNRMAEKQEENIASLTEAMERQERFLGAFAHEVKTPMTSMIGYADLLRGGTLAEEEAQQAANYIVSEGKRLEHLSQKLLSLLLVREGELPLAPASPSAVVYGLAAHLAPLYEKEGISFTCACEEGVCFLEADLLRSLLTNLWDNARKAIADDCRKTTADDCREAAAGECGHIHTVVAMTEDGCRISVRDNGAGMPEEALAHLTEAFYRVDKTRSRAQGGAGLGLALCREIAALHGGSLTFESAPGKGTCVTAELKGGRA